MIGPLFDMFTGPIFIFIFYLYLYLFFCEIPKYVQAKNRLTYFDWAFMEVG